MLLRSHALLPGLARIRRRNRDILARSGRSSSTVRSAARRSCASATASRQAAARGLRDGRATKSHAPAARARNGATAARETAHLDQHVGIAGRHGFCYVHVRATHGQHSATFAAASPSAATTSGDLGPTVASKRSNAPRGRASKARMALRVCSIVATGAARRLAARTPAVRRGHSSGNGGAKGFLAKVGIRPRQRSRLRSTRVGRGMRR
jgi:hypothetical protein